MQKTGSYLEASAITLSRGDGGPGLGSGCGGAEMCLDSGRIMKLEPRALAECVVWAKERRPG